jgi:hypothetical protein
MILMHRSTQKDSKNSSFTILQFFYDLLCIFKVFSHLFIKEKVKTEKKSNLAIGTLQIS